MRYVRRASIPIAVAIFSVITLIAIIVINSISKQLLLPLEYWLLFPVPFGILTLGVFVVRKAMVMWKYIGEINYFVGGLLFAAGLVICFFGFYGWLFLFMPFTGGW